MAIRSGKISAIEAQFNNDTGKIPFRADFPNPDRLLRHGMTGTVFIHRTLTNAIVIPQRATFEILDKRYVYVVGEDHVVHQRAIAVQAQGEAEAHGDREAARRVGGEEAAQALGGDQVPLPR